MYQHPKDPSKHTLFENMQGYLYGTAVCAFGLTLLQPLNLITGQTAGLSLLVSYITNIPFGVLFFIINLPFYWFGYKRLGLRFTINTFICVGLVSFFAEVFPYFVSFENLNPYFGAIMFGLLTGSGLMAIFRHGGSLGGIGILAIYLQDKHNIKAGWVQLGFDFILFILALLVLPIPEVLLSLLGSAVINLMIAINHRKDRYIAM